MKNVYLAMDGEIFNTLAEAIKHELTMLPKPVKFRDYNGATWNPAEFINQMPSIIVEEDLYNDNATILEQFIVNLREFVYSDDFYTENDRKGYTIIGEDRDNNPLILSGLYINDAIHGCYFCAPRTSYKHIQKMLDACKTVIGMNDTPLVYGIYEQVIGGTEDSSYEGYREFFAEFFRAEERAKELNEKAQKWDENDEFAKEGWTKEDYQNVYGFSTYTVRAIELK